MGRLFGWLVIGAIASNAMAISPAAASDTAITLTLTNGGTLSISAPATASATAASSTTSANAVIAVNGVTITDTRTFAGAFTATATSTNLTSSSDSIPSSTMTWATTNAIDSVGDPAAIAGAGGPLNVPAVAAVGLGVGLGDWQYTVDGTITMPIVNKLPGEYTGTLTMSIS